MALSAIYPFTESTNYTYNVSEVEVTGGVAQCAGAPGPYDTSDGTITPVATIYTDDLVSFSATVTEAGSDTVTFTLELAGTEMYWTGAAWAASDGTVAQTNTASDINTNIDDLTIAATGQAIRPVVYLHSDDGSTTPSIDTMTIEYNYKAQEETVTTRTVYGYVAGVLGSVKTSPVTVQLNVNNVQYKDATMIDGTAQTVDPDANGYFELELVETDNMTYPDDTSQEIYYTFSIRNRRYNRLVPAGSAVSFFDLEEPVTD